MVDRKSRPHALRMIVMRSCVTRASASPATQQGRCGAPGVSAKLSRAPRSSSRHAAHHRARWRRPWPPRRGCRGPGRRACSKPMPPRRSRARSVSHRATEPRPCAERAAPVAEDLVDDLAIPVAPVRVVRLEEVRQHDHGGQHVPVLVQPRRLEDAARLARGGAQLARRVGVVARHAHVLRERLPLRAVRVGAPAQHGPERFVQLPRVARVAGARLAACEHTSRQAGSAGRAGAAHLLPFGGVRRRVRPVQQAHDGDERQGRRPQLGGNAVLHVWRRPGRGRAQIRRLYRRSAQSSAATGGARMPGRSTASDGHRRVNQPPQQLSLSSACPSAVCLPRPLPPPARRPPSAVRPPPRPSAGCRRPPAHRRGGDVIHVNDVIRVMALRHSSAPRAHAAAAS